MSWLKKLLPSRINTSTEQKKGVPEGIWTKCDACSAVLYRAELHKNLMVCQHCQHHHRLGARDRMNQLLDDHGFIEEIAADLEPIDRLKFKDSKKYKDRIYQAQKSSGEKEAVVSVRGRLAGIPIVMSVFEFAYMGGSMGATVGEKIVAAIDIAARQKLPFICITASGGARMQEGLFSLMQMARTSAAIARYHETGLPYIVVLTDPTMGGVSASFATLGDIIIAEPNALIGFAGPRVIEQTVRQTLPEGFQRSEFLLEHGHIDMIVHRGELRTQLAELIAKLSHKTPIDERAIA